jgi:uncharacterized protein YggE
MKAQIGGASIRVADSQIAPLLGDDRIITAYRVLTPLLVTVENPNGAGAELFALVVSLGGSSFNEIKYSVNQAATQQAQERAREQAFDLAQQHAQLYATKARGTLGEIQSISEDVNSRTYRQLPLPGQPTEQVVTAEVSVVFELVAP